MDSNSLREVKTLLFKFRKNSNSYLSDKDLANYLISCLSSLSTTTKETKNV